MWVEVLYQPLEASHHDRGECYMAVVVKGGDGGCFGDWYHCSSPKTSWHHRLVQRGDEDAEDVRENPS